MKKVTSSRAYDCLVQKYIGSAYDKVKDVSDNLEKVSSVADNLTQVNLLIPELDNIKACAENIDEIKNAPIAAENANNSAILANDVLEQIKDIVSDLEAVPLGNGSWQAGQTFTAYNQFMVYNGIAYKPLTTTTLPYEPTGATPDLAFVGPFDANDHSKLNNRDEAGAHPASAIDGAMWHVGTVKDLQGLVGVGGIQVSVASYHDLDYLSGGGTFVWGTGRHNGGTFIDPNRPFPTDWNDQGQLKTWFAESSSDVGGWSRTYENDINVSYFGYLKDSNNNETFKAVANHVELSKERVSGYEKDTTFVVSTSQISTIQKAANLFPRYLDFKFSIEIEPGDYSAEDVKVPSTSRATNQNLHEPCSATIKSATGNPDDVLVGSIFFVNAGGSNTQDITIDHTTPLYSGESGGLAYWFCSGEVSCSNIKYSAGFVGAGILAYGSKVEARTIDVTNLDVLVRAKRGAEVHIRFCTGDFTGDRVIVSYEGSGVVSGNHTFTKSSGVWADVDGTSTVINRDTGEYSYSVYNQIPLLRDNNLLLKRTTNFGSTETLLDGVKPLNTDSVFTQLGDYCFVSGSNGKNLTLDRNNYQSADNHRRYKSDGTASGLSLSADGNIYFHFYAAGTEDDVVTRASAKSIFMNAGGLRNDSDNVPWINGSSSGKFVLTPSGTFGASSDSNVIQLLNRTGTDGAVTSFYKNGSAVGGISVSSNATAYNTSSDYRLKTNIRECDNALSIVKNLNPVTFDWIRDGSTTTGFLAHELAEQIPEAVTGTKDELNQDGEPVYQAVDHSKIVPYLTKVIQDLMDRVEQLERIK